MNAPVQFLPSGTLLWFVLRLCQWICAIM